jgi:hypothetical protein
MDMEMLKERILRWQLLAEQYFKDNQKVFIKTINGNINFCDIVLVGETKITVDIYDPSQRSGTRDYIDWLEIVTFEKVREAGA